jgi:hypothetical protein
MVVGHEGVWVVSGFFWVNEREREGEIDVANEGKKSLLPLPLHVREEEDTQCCSKRHCFGIFFLMNSE